MVWCAIFVHPHGWLACVPHQQQCFTNQFVHSHPFPQINRVPHRQSAAGERLESTKHYDFKSISGIAIIVPIHNLLWRFFCSWLKFSIWEWQFHSSTSFKWAMRACEHEQSSDPAILFFTGKLPIMSLTKWPRNLTLFFVKLCLVVVVLSYWSYW